MERDMDRHHHSESLVRKLTEERERFVSAWQQGARSQELNRIRQNIKQLNDQLWDSTIQQNGIADRYRSAGGTLRDQQTRTGPMNRP